jgi:hypothetical protein
VDIDATLDACARWCAHHPEWRRPPGGMYRAIQTWFSRERTHAARARQALPEINPTREEIRAVLFRNGRRPPDRRAAWAQPWRHHPKGPGVATPGRAQARNGRRAEPLFRVQCAQRIPEKQPGSRRLSG